eukprot:2042983-Pyramimonas_sp.AAC.2
MSTLRMRLGFRGQFVAIKRFARREPALFQRSSTKDRNSSAFQVYEKSFSRGRARAFNTDTFGCYLALILHYACTHLCINSGALNVRSIFRMPDTHVRPCFVSAGDLRFSDADKTMVRDNLLESIIHSPALIRCSSCQQPVPLNIPRKRSMLMP